ncbi:MAG: NAD(P)-dependent oxidoreductase [Rhodospirillaceae bacterium]
MSDKRTYGFIGLGQMGGPMADNIAKAGLELHVFDAAGTKGRAHEKAIAHDSLAGVLGNADTVFFSLPDGNICTTVAREIVQINDRKTSVVVDLSTIGTQAAQDIDVILKDAGISYIDAPVSGGRRGAIAGSIAIMAAGPKALYDEHVDAFKTFAKNPFYVGEAAGQGQVVKMLNNYLSAMAMTASTEAVLFGLSQGLEMKTILDVVNVSTGRNTATEDKFPNRVMTETYDAGFFAKLLAKDVRLFKENSTRAGTPNQLGVLLSGIWDKFAAEQPDADLTRIYEFVRDGKA